MNENNSNVENILKAVINRNSEWKFFGHVMLCVNFSTYEGAYETTELIKFGKNKSISVRLVAK